MKDLIIEILKIVAPIAVALIVFAQGLGVAPGSVLGYWRERPGLMLRSLLATLVLVPAAALGLILLLKPESGVAIGLAILVSCPPAPLMLKSAPKKGGASASFMASLHLSLAALAFLTVPAILDLLSIPLGFNAEVDLGAMAWVLGRTILLPVALGIGARALSAPLADRFAPVLEKIGMLGIAVVAVVALAAFYPTLLAMAPWSYAVILCVSLAALAIGHFLGATDPHERTTLAVECAVRHPVLAISIAALNFSPAKALPVLVPCVITCIVVAIVYINLRGRSLRNAVAHA